MSGREDECFADKHERNHHFVHPALVRLESSQQTILVLLVELPHHAFNQGLGTFFGPEF